MGYSAKEFRSDSLTVYRFVRYKRKRGLVVVVVPGCGHSCHALLATHGAFVLLRGRIRLYVCMALHEYCQVQGSAMDDRASRTKKIMVMPNPRCLKSATR